MGGLQSGRNNSFNSSRVIAWRRERRKGGRDKSSSVVKWDRMCLRGRPPKRGISNDARGGSQQGGLREK